MYTVPPLQQGAAENTYTSLFEVSQSRMARVTLSATVHTVVRLQPFAVAAAGLNVQRIWSGSLGFGRDPSFREVLTTANTRPVESESSDLRLK